MKISIYNFKSIGTLVNYEMRPLTILSGTNSSGKSSFIQFLLLLRQSIDTIKKDNVLNIDSNLFQVRDYIDIIKDKKKENKLCVEFKFNKNELLKYEEYKEFSVYRAFDDYELNIIVKFDLFDNQIIVTDFEAAFIQNDSVQQSYLKIENNSNSSFDVKANTSVFISNELLTQIKNKECVVRNINYTAFFPSEFEIEEIVPEIEGLATEPSRIQSTEVPKLDGIKAILKDFFTNLNYVGPYRKAPQDAYPTNARNISVGIDGANVAEAICELAERTIVFYKIVETEENVSFIKTEDTFLNAVKYWLCERFKLCSDIYSKKEADSFVISVVSLSGVKSTIKHVGFGISQILPIIVEGLRIGNNETFVLEQPEIHLHPKVQSNLTDFFISLVEQGKNIILETHSDHIITRLRRRIAEDYSNQLDNKVLLTFVEVGKKDVVFRNVPIDDFGVIELPYPEEFIENPDTELTAILKAQMSKRLNRKEK